MKHKKKQKRSSRIARLEKNQRGKDSAQDNTLVASESESEALTAHASGPEEQDTDLSSFSLDNEDFENHHAMRMFTVPPAAGEDSDSTTELLCFNLTQQRVFAQPNFPSPIRAVPVPPIHEVGPAPGMGLGVFAERDIKAGEFIFAERPLLVVPAGITNFGLSPDGLSEEEQTQAMMDNWESTFDLLVERMTEANRAALFELVNSHTDDGSGPITGIIRTNGCAVDELDEESDDSADKIFFSSTAIGKLGARLNHSCVPNIMRRFDLESFAMTYTATRDIAKGSQLFTSYCQLEQSAEKRLTALKPYGITRCICTPCTNATPERDRFREEFYQRTQEHFRKGLMWEQESNTPVSSADFRALLEFQRMAIEEGLDRTMFYVQILTTVLIAYKKLGLDKKASEAFANAKATAALCGVSLL